MVTHVGDISVCRRYRLLCPGCYIDRMTRRPLVKTHDAVNNNRHQPSRGIAAAAAQYRRVEKASRGDAVDAENAIKQGESQQSTWSMSIFYPFVPSRGSLHSSHRRCERGGSMRENRKRQRLIFFVDAVCWLWSTAVNAWLIH